MYLTFNMIVQNSAEYITPTLESIKDIADEIVIVDGGSTDDTISICAEYTKKIFIRKFNGDFASQKNYANIKSNGRWIFNIDSDETLSDGLKENLVSILKENETVDLFRVPRINIVNGITDAHLAKWNWTKNKHGWINYPDYQSRLYRNRIGVSWRGAVHEIIVGYKNFGRIPPDSGLDLVHIKDITRQEQQNNLYSTY